MATAHDHTSLLITRGGLAYAWGYSGEYQSGLRTDRDIEIPTIVRPSNVLLNSKFSWAGLGERFGVLVAPIHKGDENSSHRHSSLSDPSYQAQR
jgi:regulator of chromosome condensation